MSRRLYIVRHGETDANLNHIVQGQLFDNSLNETGKKQAELTALALADADFSCIFVSSASRAGETGQYILEKHNRNKPKRWVGINHGLLEINQGIFEGMTTEQVQKKYPDLYWMYKNRPSAMVFPKGEVMVHALARVSLEIRTILGNYPSDNILIVSHGGAIALMFIDLFKWNIDIMYHAIRHENCAISIVEWPTIESRPSILVMNDTCHLKKISEK